MKKDLDYYMSLYYTVEIVKIPEEEGGGYAAMIPQLGRNVFLADGETVEEAYHNLEEVKREWFQTYLERGTSIPKPEKELEKHQRKSFIHIARKFRHYNHVHRTSNFPRRNIGYQKAA